MLSSVTVAVSVSSLRHYWFAWPASCGMCNIEEVRTGGGRDEAGRLKARPSTPPLMAGGC